MRNNSAVFLLLIVPLFVSSQIPFNVTVTNPEAEEILKGRYNPGDYLPQEIKGTPADIACALNENISADSLYSYLLRLGSFQNRNTYSDTLSNTSGIGAARRWVHDMFRSFNSENENRLGVSYLQFEMDSTALCGSGQFRNIFAVLPGSDTSDNSIVIIEAHLDTRCEDACDTGCLAEGADDNGSGTALVLELARVLSRFTFTRTIVFLVTVGEEQGLFGAEAFAKYADDNGIAIRAVQNNDIVGGIMCGETSSPPSCPVVAHIDSLQVRIFSSGLHNSRHKCYARFVKMMYSEWLLPVAAVPMTVSIMQPEDRIGRGGDHIPFRQRGYTAIRFSSANEHGHGDPADSTYHDRQHSTRDILGVDANGDFVIDSFFVDFNYLARNTTINGMAAAMAALAPPAPLVQINAVGNQMLLTIEDSEPHLHYRVGIRTSTQDFDVVYEVKDSSPFSIPGLQAGFVYRVSTAAINDSGVMSLFSNEVSFTSGVTTASLTGDTLRYSNLDCKKVGVNELLGNRKTISLLIHPNPFSSTTEISILINEAMSEEGILVVTDILGRQRMWVKLSLKHDQSVSLNSEDLVPGIYSCALFIKGRLVQNIKMLVLK